MCQLDITKLHWNAEGLLPAILQDYLTGKVLMLAYMNEEAVKKTIETQEAWFWSRSRKQLWHKGATSGNRQRVKSMLWDCDKDTLLIKVEPLGPACHLGTESCFGRESELVVEQIVKIIAQRYQERPEGSYTTYLFAQGLDKILKKVGEEAAEVIIAAKNTNNEELAQEAADLIYHLLVLFQAKNLDIKKVIQVLDERRN